MLESCRESLPAGETQQKLQSESPPIPLRTIYDPLLTDSSVPSVPPAPAACEPQAVGRAGQARLLEADGITPSEIVTAIWSSSQLGGFTDRESAVVSAYVETPCLHLFCGQSRLGDVRVDLSAESEATVIQDILDYLAYAPKAQFRSVIADPPYNGKYQAEYGVAGSDFGGNEANLGRLLKEMFRVCAPGGLLIFKHWFDPAWAGAKLQHQVVTKYGGHRRITLLTVYRKSDWG